MPGVPTLIRKLTLTIRQIVGDMTREENVPVDPASSQDRDCPP